MARPSQATSPPQSTPSTERRDSHNAADSTSHPKPTTKKVWACSGCTLAQSESRPLTHFDPLVQHVEAANSHAFLYYLCPGCFSTSCTVEDLIVHFETCGMYQGHRFHTDSAYEATMSQEKYARRKCVQWTKVRKEMIEVIEEEVEEEEEDSPIAPEEEDQSMQEMDWRTERSSSDEEDDGSEPLDPRIRIAS